MKHTRNSVHVITKLNMNTFFQEDMTKLSEIENSLAIFCMATYGEGDPTDNAQEFFDWLQDGSVELEGLNYAVSTPFEEGWFDDYLISKVRLSENYGLILCLPCILDKWKLSLKRDDI